MTFMGFEVKKETVALYVALNLSILERDLKSVRCLATLLVEYLAATLALNLLNPEPIRLLIRLPKERGTDLRRAGEDIVLRNPAADFPMGAREVREP